MRKSGSKFLTRALRLITEEGDVETHGDNKIAHGCLFYTYVRTLTSQGSLKTRKRARTGFQPDHKHDPTPDIPLTEFNRL